MITVERIQDERGSHIEPPLDPNWDALARLRWHAAVIALDSGCDIEVGEGNTSILRDGVWETIADTYSVRVEAGAVGSYCASGNYHETWSFLNGVRVGARAAESHCSIAARNELMQA